MAAVSATKVFLKGIEMRQVTERAQELKAEEIEAVSGGVQGISGLPGWVKTVGDLLRYLGVAP
jgi:hypothetical protein